MFSPEFAGLVASGDKCQSVRGTPAVMPAMGDPLSLRKWAGKPYRSKQIVIREARVLSAKMVRISERNRLLDGRYLDGLEDLEFAHAEGFGGVDEMLGWFACAYGLPFRGVVIEWEAD
jgi:hypothetical protein